jgi:hypothetical protein
MLEDCVLSLLAMSPDHSSVTITNMGRKLMVTLNVKINGYIEIDYEKKLPPPTSKRSKRTYM